MVNFLKSNYKIETILIVSLPFLMIISRFFLEFFLLIISASFLFKIIKTKVYTIFNNYFLIYFFCFYCLLLLSFSFSEEKLNILSILLYFRFGLYTLAIYYFLKSDKYIIKFFLYSVLIAVLILFFDSLTQDLFGHNLIGLKNFETHRITSFFGDEQILGSYVLRLFPFLFILKYMSEENSKIMNYLNLLAILAVPVIIFLSGERVAMVLFFLTICYYLIFFARSKKFKFIYLYTVFLILGTVSFLYSSNIYYERYINSTYQSIFNKSFSQNKFFLPDEYQKNNFYFLSAQHQNFIYTGMNIFKKNKFLGTGPKSYRYVCKNKDYAVNKLSCNTHPHNYYLQILIETGMLGFIFLILIYLYIIYRSCLNFIKLLKNQYFDLSEVIILSFYFVQLWPIMQHGNIFNNWNSITLFLPMAFFLYLKKREDGIKSGSSK